jgi:hypothetical protein
MHPLQFVFRWSKATAPAEILTYSCDQYCHNGCNEIKKAPLWPKLVVLRMKRGTMLAHDVVQAGLFGLTKRGSFRENGLAAASVRRNQTQILQLPINLYFR